MKHMNKLFGQNEEFCYNKQYVQEPVHFKC